MHELILIVEIISRDYPFNMIGPINSIIFGWNFYFMRLAVLF